MVAKAIMMEGHIAEPRRQPVAPTGDEPGERPPAGIGVGEDAVQVATLLGEVVQRERQRQKSHTHDKPAHKHCARRCHLGQLPRDGEYAGADAGADDHADEADKADALLALCLFHEVSLLSCRFTYAGSEGVAARVSCKARASRGRATHKASRTPRETCARPMAACRA